MSTNNEPKESEYTYYAITPIRNVEHPEKPLIKIDGHFRLLKEEKPGKLEVLTGTNNRNFYNDLEVIITSMEHENEIFSKHTFLKCIVKIPYNNMPLRNMLSTSGWSSSCKCTVKILELSFSSF